ncbi:sulfurtransferase [Mycolicibacterium celeriflavum]|uniref:rhodanese-like domain-containing protein n=1 Tax=Mycolicibacterium celeriflavum TaxID=1249101 RepID=UPI0007FDD323|nr:rhodanese-like domain-containing protein [Mycolicibacterium celeriflavum]OBG20161.1 sulfurtransferase [Mycolicibacterium celeriflavum]
MIFHQYFLQCLSQMSYLIGDEISGRAVVVDPRRDISVYVVDAAAAGLHIERVIETHCHADFVSGHLELAAMGAVISYGEGAQVDFPVELLVDGQRLHLGEVLLEIRATPGHTPESISIVVYEDGADTTPYGVLTGDTLFIGDVGRPDLLSEAGHSSVDMAVQLYRSVHDQLLTLPDETRVFPAHGAGSACGKNLSTETSSTIGVQRRDNYALALPNEVAFVAALTDGQSPAPPYFSFDARRNREWRSLLDERHPPTPIAFSELCTEQFNDAVLLDTREPHEFAAAHLRGSINVGLAGRFAQFAGSVLGPEQRIVLVAPPGRELESKIRLGRIGFDNVVGYLADPTAVLGEHADAVVRSSRVTVAQLQQLRAQLPNLVVLDVRNPGERVAGAVPGAVAIPLSCLMQRIDELDHSRPVVVYCASGYRSVIAASKLSAEGFVDVSDLLGGYSAWAAVSAAA